MTTVIERKGCPQCGSSDNLVVWDDDHSWCFTPNCSYNKGKRRPHSLYNTRISNAVKNFKPIRLQPVRLPKRRLLADTCSRYGIGVHNQQIHFPYCKDGKIIGYKVRNHAVPKKDKKHFYVKGSINNTLFGNQCVHNKNVIAITSGEYDACSVFQMVGISAVSLHSDGAAKGTVTENLEWLESFEKIILCIDNDESGDKAREIICSIIRPYQLYSMVFPTGYKDANDLLVAKQSELFSKAFWAARAAPIKVIYSKDVLRQEVLAHSQIPEGIPTGIDQLDKSLGGLRPGEITSVLAKTYQGKSTFCRIVLSNLIRSGHKCLIAALEEQPIKYVRRLLHTYAKRPVITLDKKEKTFLVDEMLSQLEVSTLNSKVDTKELTNCIEYAVRRDKVRIVVVDNITAAIDKSKLFEQTSAFMEALTQAAKTFNIHIIVVCHIHRTKKDQNGSLMEGGYGSSSIEQLSDNMLIIKKEEDNRVIIDLMKNRELGTLTTVRTVFNSQTANYVFHERTKKQQTRANNFRQLSSKKDIIEIKRAHLDSLYTKEPSS